MFRRFVFAPAIVGVLCVLVCSPLLAQSGEEGKRLWKEAYELQERAQSNEDLKRAAQKYEEALKIFVQLGDLSSQGPILNSLGALYADRGQQAKAVEFYEKALQIARKLGSSMGEGQILGNLGNVYLSSGQYSKAVEQYEKTLALFRKVGDENNLSRSLNNLGNVYKDWGQYAKAAQFYEKALVIKRKLRDDKGEGQTLMNLGNVYRHWGQYDKATEFYEKSLQISGRNGFVKEQGQTLNNLGLVYETRGQYPKAVDLFEQCLEKARRMGDADSEAAGLTNLGNVYKAWAQYGKAVEFLEKSLETVRKTGNVASEGQTLVSIGRVYADWGRYAEAVNYYEKSLEMFRQIGNLKGEGVTLTNLGQVYRHRGEHDKALATFQKALEIYLKIGIPAETPKDLIGHLYLDKDEPGKAEPYIREAKYDGSLGRLDLVKGNYASAKTSYESLLKSAERNRDTDDLFTAFAGLGMSYEGLGDNRRAEEHYARAVALTEDIRSSLTPADRESFFDVRIGGFYRTAPYDGLARVLAKMNRGVEAFKESEYTRARIFAEAMSKRSEQAGWDVPKNVREKDSQLTDELAALTKNLQKAYEKQNKDQIAALEPRAQEAKEKLAAHVTMLRKQYPLFAATKYPQPMDLSQTDLKDNEWVLAYHVTDPGIVIYLTKGKNLVRGLFKPIPRKVVDEVVRKFREPIELAANDSLPNKLAAFDFKSGRKLSDILLADIISDLPKTTPVIVVPDGSLGVVPFETLVLNDGGKIVTDGDRPRTSGAEFFGDRNPISYYQSITALTLARTLGKQQKLGERLLAIVDPVFSSYDPRLVNLAKREKEKLLATLPTDLTMSIQTETGIGFPRLLLTTQLGKSLKDADPSRTDLYEGITAKKSALVEKDLTPYRSLVFATHGYFGKDLPGIQEPVLVLSLVGEPKGRDGFLRLSEVMGLKMNCDIAALTACQTGLGKHISGEGTMGMGRAFQYAGAKSVLMSLWSVSETASVNLVEGFFKNLRAGKSKLEALRLARDEIRKAGYDHPFYWAAFILVGEVN